MSPCFDDWLPVRITIQKISKAIRLNVLKNPTGKKGRFRAVDWIVEHNNLYTKVSIEK